MRKNILKALISFLLIVPLFNLPSTMAQADKATIIVYVQDNTGEKIEGIEIAVSGPSDYSQTKNTASDGKVTLSDLNTGSYTITINLLSGGNYELVSGETSSKTRTLENADQETVYFNIKEKQTDETDEEEMTGNAQIPAKFYQSGSTSTDISDYTTQQLSSIKNFTLHVPDYAKIVFTEPVNLSSSETIGRLKVLDQYVFLDQRGEVAVASDLMPELNKPANITLYGLEFASLGSDYKPAILKDDSEPSASDVTNVSLTGGDTITFDVKGFSAYAVRPTLLFENTELEADNEEYTLTGKIDDIGSEITVFLNDNRVNQDVEIAEDGSFSIDLKLDKGENKVQITANGVSEQTIAEALTINFNSTGGSDKGGLDLTMIAGIMLIGLGIAGGGFYYYKTKYLPKKRGTSISPEKGQSAFDSRLLTPEERLVFGKENDDKKS